MENNLSELLGAESNLTEEFKSQVSVLFGEAVEAKVAALVEEKCKAAVAEAEAKCKEDCEKHCAEKCAEKDAEHEAALKVKAEEYEAQIAALTESHKEELAVIEGKVAEMADTLMTEQYKTLESDINTYLNYVVENFVTKHENELIESARNDIAYSMFEGMKSLFEQNNIERPEAVAKLEEQAAAHQHQLNESFETIADLIEQKESLESEIKSMKVEMALADVAASHNLSESQFGKLADLIEGFTGTVEEVAAKADAIALELVEESKGDAAQTVVAEQNATVIAESAPVITEDSVDEPAPAPVVETPVLDADVAGVMAALTRKF